MTVDQQIRALRKDGIVEWWLHVRGWYIWHRPRRVYTYIPEKKHWEYTWPELDGTADKYKSVHWCEAPKRYSTKGAAHRALLDLQKHWTNDDLCPRDFIVLPQGMKPRRDMKIVIKDPNHEKDTTSICPGIRYSLGKNKEGQCVLVKS